MARVVDKSEKDMLAALGEVCVEDCLRVLRVEQECGRGVALIEPELVRLPIRQDHVHRIRERPTILRQPARHVQWQAAVPRTRESLAAAFDFPQPFAGTIETWAK